MDKLSWKQNLQRKLWRSATQQDSPLDQARYLSVSTGRIEPYLRQLTQQLVWYQPEKTAQPPSAPAPAGLATSVPPLSHLPASAQPSGYRPVWSSRARARYDHPQLSGNSWKNALISEIPHQNGIIVDPGWPSELTLEAKHLRLVDEMHAGQAKVEGFSPIGMETLICCPLAETQKTQLKSWNQQLITGYHWRGCQIKVQGFGDLWYPVRFLYNPAGDAIGSKTYPGQLPTPKPTPTDQEKREWVTVDPEQWDWPVELLWDFRGEASAEA